MFAVQDYAVKMSFPSAKEIWEVFGAAQWISSAMGEGWEQLLPRVCAEGNQWFAEGWWRSLEDGTLGYYAKINMQTGMVKEFRELSQDTRIDTAGDPAAREQYLTRCVAAVKDAAVTRKAAEELDLLWQAAVPAALREIAQAQRKEKKPEKSLMPLEALTYWNWERLKQLLLKRYNTTVEDVLDYEEYLDSESKERYIEPKMREEARKKGLRFWRDGYDD